MGDGVRVAAVVVAGIMLLGQCREDPVTAAKVGAGAAGIAAGVAAGSAAGAAASGAAKGVGKRVEDRVSGRGRPSPRPSPNGPSRPSPATTVPMAPVTTVSPLVEDFDLCTALADLPGCVVSP